MNSTTTIQGIKNIQAALNVLAALQLTAYLWPQQAQLSDGAEFDFIVVGAGSAGSVIANRLTEIDEATVLLIEAGGDPPIESVIPIFTPFMKNTGSDWKFSTEDDGYSQQFHKNHGVELTRGKMLGGSSSINFMAYTRGNKHDFDNWAKLTGDESWNWDNVLPYFMKSERLVDPILLNSAENTFHGTDGYLGVSKDSNPEAIKYLEAFKEMGNNVVLDNCGEHPLGYLESLLTIAEGIRQSTAYSFLAPIKHRPYLFVLKNTLVSKIIFDANKNAVGVETILQNGSQVIFKANKEVIISAGAINTPQLLMLSGIGPKEHLQSKNINVISNLPVGQRLQDHVMVSLVHRMGKADPSKPPNPGKIGLPLIIGYTALNKTQNYPDYQTLNFIINEPSGILNLCSFFFSFKDEICDDMYNKSIGREVLFTSLVLSYPESRGEILLRSKDPTDKPIVYTGYYSKHNDLENHAKYLKHFAEMKYSELFRNVESKLVVPQACGCGENSDNEEFWECYALCMMVAGYHYVGSCPMGDVVDSDLRVYGVQKLRIADASIMPMIVGANTNAATIMIGEKVSDIIKDKYYFQRMFDFGESCWNLNNCYRY